MFNMNVAFDLLILQSRYVCNYISLPISHVYTTAHLSTYLQAFWEVVLRDLNEEDKRKLLFFWSGSSVPPAMGFARTPEDDYQWTISKLTGRVGR